jgi:hypothetical protein
MVLTLELGRATESLCSCCGKLSHAVRGFVSKDGVAYAAYLAGYTEQHLPEEGTILVSIGDWSEGSRPKDRKSVCMKVRRPTDGFQVMVVGLEGAPWADIDVFGPVLSRAAALGSADIQDYFHVVDHVLAGDERFAAYFSEAARIAADPKVVN